MACLVLLGFHYLNLQPVFYCHYFCYCCRGPEITPEEVAGIIRGHFENMQGDAPGRITVPRSAVWKKAHMFFMSKRSRGSRGLLLVTFSDAGFAAEDGLDQGGLRREFFRLLLPAVVKESGIFCGTH